MKKNSNSSEDRVICVGLIQCKEDYKGLGGDYFNSNKSSTPPTASCLAIKAEDGKYTCPEAEACAKANDGTFGMTGREFNEESDIGIRQSGTGKFEHSYEREGKPNSTDSK